VSQEEIWSWKKFFKGFFVGKNYAKALVMMFCMMVIIVIGFSVYSTVMRYAKPKPVIPTSSIGTNSGTVTNQTDTSNREKKSWQLFGGLIQINS
jgi:hypothetical protein